MAPPRFIVLDGPDGSGTTYHSGALAERLADEGHDVLLTAEPSEGPVGFWVRKQLKTGADLPPDALQLLFCADRAWHVQEVIRPALAAGKYVICDRYGASTVAYGEAFGVDAAWLGGVNAAFPKPDTHIFLLPPLEVAMERIARRESTDSFEKRAVQEKVHAAYARMAREDVSVRVLDSAGSKEETAERLWHIVREGM